MKWRLLSRAHGCMGALMVCMLAIAPSADAASKKKAEKKSAPAKKVKVDKIPLDGDTKFKFSVNAQARMSEVATPGVATLLGNAVPNRDRSKLVGIVLDGLLQHYAEENQIIASSEDIDAFVQFQATLNTRMREEWQKDQDRLKQELATELPEPAKRIKQAQLDAITTLLGSSFETEQWNKNNPEEAAATDREVASKRLQTWKINQSLFTKFGGRVIPRDNGPEPIDAYKAFLEGEEKRGKFKIHDAGSREGFWKYFSVARPQMVSDPAEAARLINTPPWETQTDAH